MSEARKSRSRLLGESPVFGLAIAIGAALIMTVIAAMIHDARPLLIAVWPCAVVAVWEAARIFQAENIKAVSFAGAVISAAGIFLLYVELSPDRFDNSESLPGFSGYTVIQFLEEPAARRKFYFTASDPEGARVALYQSKSDMFRWVAVDADGEMEALDIPSGKNGIPINTPIVLTFDIGVAADHSFMRLVVNGHPVGERNFPFRLQLGSRNWTELRMGASPQGNDSGRFMFFEAARYPQTLTQDQTDKIVRNARMFYKF
jgi:hypothetical protein